MSLVERAMTWAAIWHAGQRRKYTNDPYMVHCLNVAKLVSQYGGDDEQVAAALLHDTVEDCGVTLEEIEGRFGEHVAALVEGLTDVSKPEDGNREVRKALDRAHTAIQSPACMMIKLCDLIDNTERIVKHDAAFAKVYMAEKRLLLEAMRGRVGRLEPFARALAIVEEYERGLPPADLRTRIEARFHERDSSPTTGFIF